MSLVKTTQTVYAAGSPGIDGRTAFVACPAPPPPVKPPKKKQVYVCGTETRYAASIVRPDLAVVNGYQSFYQAYYNGVLVIDGMGFSFSAADMAYGPPVINPSPYASVPFCTYVWVMA